VAIVKSVLSGIFEPKVIEVDLMAIGGVVVATETVVTSFDRVIERHCISPKKKQDDDVKITQVRA
jgi:hypothetical protein